MMLVKRRGQIFSKMLVAQDIMNKTVHRSLLHPDEQTLCGIASAIISKVTSGTKRKSKQKVRTRAREKQEIIKT